MGAVTRANKAAESRRRFHERRVVAAKDRGVDARLTRVWGWWLAEFAKASDATRAELVDRLHAEARELNAGSQS